MTVYLHAQVTITDRTIYKRYEKAFMSVFSQFEGTLLSVDEKPTILEGEWTATRSVLMQFPSAQAAEDWYHSAAYQEIAKDRFASASTTLFMAKGLDEKG